MKYLLQPQENTCLLSKNWSLILCLDINNFSFCDIPGIFTAYEGTENNLVNYSLKLLLLESNENIYAFIKNDGEFTCINY